MHYNHDNIALLLLQHAASPHVTARNGYTPLHIAAKKNALDIAEMLLEYNANTNAQSTGGFTPLHLSCQDGHSDMTYLLLANHADPHIASKYHLTPLHLCAQEDRVKCAEALVNKNADVDAQTLVSGSAEFPPDSIAMRIVQCEMRKRLRVSVDSRRLAVVRAVYSSF